MPDFFLLFYQSFCDIETKEPPNRICVWRKKNELDIATDEQNYRLNRFHSVEGFNKGVDEVG